MEHLESHESEALLASIQEALGATPAADGIHISIEPHAREIAEPDGTVAYLKALCWNLVRGGEPVSEDDPVLCLVHEDITDDSLRAEAESRFPGRLVVVDNDILVEEDP